MIFKCKRHEALAVLFAVLFLIPTFMMSSCSVLRGLRTDGKNGPGIYSDKVWKPLQMESFETLANNWK